jgi:hypothetical protein
MKIVVTVVFVLLVIGCLAVIGKKSATGAKGTYSRKKREVRGRAQKNQRFQRKSEGFAQANIALVRRTQAEKECRKQMKEIGHDLVRVADCCDSTPSDPCSALHGRIVSAFGKVPGFPTLADLDAEIIFGGELGHRLDYVDETIDADEIKRQRRI